MNHKKVAEINYVLRKKKKNGAVNCSLIALLYKVRVHKTRVWIGCEHTEQKIDICVCVNLL